LIYQISALLFFLIAIAETRDKKNREMLPTKKEQEKRRKRLQRGHSTIDTIQDFFSNFRIKWQLN
jgi:hypothetical protein